MSPGVALWCVGVRADMLHSQQPMSPWLLCKVEARRHSWHWESQPQGVSKYGFVCGSPKVWKNKEVPSILWRFWQWKDRFGNDIFCAMPPLLQDSWSPLLLRGWRGSGGGPYACDVKSIAVGPLKQGGDSLVKMFPIKTSGGPGIGTRICL